MEELLTYLYICFLLLVFHIGGTEYRALPITHLQLYFLIHSRGQACVSWRLLFLWDMLPCLGVTRGLRVQGTSSLLLVWPAGGSHSLSLGPLCSPHYQRTHRPLRKVWYRNDRAWRGWLPGLHTQGQSYNPSSFRCSFSCQLHTLSKKIRKKNSGFLALLP